MKKFLSLLVLVVAVAFTSQAEVVNGAGNDNIVYDIGFDLPTPIAIVDNATATVTPFTNVAVVTVNYKNVGGFDAEVPSNSVVAIINIINSTNGNKGFSETVSDLTNIAAVGNEKKYTEYATNTETVNDSLYPDKFRNSDNTTKYSNERIKTNVGKFKRNI